MKRIGGAVAVFLGVVGGSSVGCGSKPEASEPNGGAVGSDSDSDSAVIASEAYGPLEVGADYRAFKKVSTGPFESPTHGNRFVEIYVNDIGYDAYTKGGEVPEGTVVVKTSLERDGDKASDAAGPTFVMQKLAKGASEETSDWHYEMHWERVPDSWVAKVGGKQVYWRTPSARVAYCGDCHDSYDRQFGGVPESKRAW